MAQAALIDAYQAFMATAHRYVRIQNEGDYNGALAALEEILECTTDTLDDPLNPLIDMLSHAIEQYESGDKKLTNFLKVIEGMPVDVAMLKTLMNQHKLVGSDFPEIGDKTMVSKILNGKRQLTRQAIEKLSARFVIRPAMFFGETN